MNIPRALTVVSILSSPFTLLASMNTANAQSAELADPPSPHELAGRYVLIDDPTEARAQIEAAIEQSVSRIAVMFRGLARDMLRAKNPLMERVEVAFRDDEIQVRFSDDVVYVSPASGEKVVARAPDGERVRLSQQSDDERLIQIFASRDGRRTNTFRRSKDGQQLLLDVEVRSQRLPEPVRYRLRFQRSEP